MNRFLRYWWGSYTSVYIVICHLVGLLAFKREVKLLNFYFKLLHFIAIILYVCMWLIRICLEGSYVPWCTWEGQSTLWPQAWNRLSDLSNELFTCWSISTYLHRVTELPTAHHLIARIFEQIVSNNLLLFGNIWKVELSKPQSWQKSRPESVCLLNNEDICRISSIQQKEKEKTFSMLLHVSNSYL